jgi:predicted adenylyl cyclase CyaB
MPTNLELKARYPSLQEAHACAAALGAARCGLLIQQDTYFRIPRGRLKLREAEGETAELIYYERVEESAERWSRFTREPVAATAGLVHVLTEAFGVLAVVRKRRELYIFRDARIHIDDVEGLGTFVEFEVTGGEIPSSVATMRELRNAFRIDEESVIRVSYSDLILEKRMLEKRISGGS